MWIKDRDPVCSRIRVIQKDRILADPDPQHWSEVSVKYFKMLHVYGGVKLVVITMNNVSNVKYIVNYEN